MRAVVVYESMFGNTEILAETVGAGLRDADVDVTVVDVKDPAAVEPVECDLLVIAAPTHALTLSTPDSRAQAVERGADPGVIERGVREWLPVLERLASGCPVRPVVAMFDTRVLLAKHWPGSAAHRAARILRKEGFIIVDRRSFYVDGIAGPVSPGELERTHTWATGLPELVRQARSESARRER